MISWIVYRLWVNVSPSEELISEKNLIRWVLHSLSLIRKVARLKLPGAYDNISPEQTDYFDSAIEA